MRAMDGAIRQNNRRELLLSAAARLFASKGFEATSMRDIAAAVGMMPGSLYYHFPSKDELFVAVHGAGIAGISEAVLGALEGVSDPWKRLEAAAAAHLRALVEGGDLSAVVTPDFPTRDALVRQRLVAQRDAYDALFQGLIDELPLREGVDRRLLRLQLLGSLNWAPTWFRNGRRSAGAVAKAMVANLRHALDPRGCS
ncbi:MAG: TetR/AcrR family transcriptional regulator [Thalassobaculales bacterium]